MSWQNYKDKLNRYFWFSKEEITHYIIVVLALTVIYTWNDWGAQSFNPATGMRNFFFGAILIAIVVFVHHAGQRMFALGINFKAEQKLWWYGLLIGLMIVMVTDGKVKFLAATGTTIYLLPAHRLGAFRYGPNLTSIAKTCLAGPIAVIFFSAIIKTIEWIGLLNPTIGSKIFNLCLAYAAWNLIPIPPLDGAKVFYYSRLVYVFLFGTIASYALMVFFLNIYSYILALLIGCITWLTYYILWETKL